VWRGPMVSRAIEQLLSDVRWGELDYLIVDLPPGTGDASLTLAQAVPLTGVAVVCTPQEAALRIALKALQMFRGLNVPALGLIENMSWFVCDDCGKEHFIFDHGRAERAAQRLGVPYLGAIPLEGPIREAADAGAPVVVTRPDSAGAQRPLGTLETGHLPFEFLAHLEDELGDGAVIHVGFRRAQPLRRNAREVARQRSETALLGVSRHARKLQQLQRDAGIQRWFRDVRAAALCGIDPVLSERFEEWIHQPHL